MTRLRMSLICSVVTTGLVLVPTLAGAQSPSGLTSAQLKQLKRLNMPVVAPVPPPKGFRVSRVVPNAYDKTYKIFYQNTLGATIVFEASEAYSTAQAGSAGAAASQPPPPAPKRGHGLLQRIFAGPANAQTQAPASNGLRGTSSEAEGQAGGAIVADSPLIGPIRFVPAGPCLQGTADQSKSRIRGLRVTVSACNSDNPDPLIAAYKNVHRL